MILTGLIWQMSFSHPWKGPVFLLSSANRKSRRYRVVMIFDRKHPESIDKSSTGLSED